MTKLAPENWTILVQLEADRPLRDNELDGMLDYLAATGAAMSVSRDEKSVDLILTAIGLTRDSAIGTAASLTMMAAATVGLDVSITWTDAVTAEQHDELAAAGRAPFLT